MGIALGLTISTVISLVGLAKIIWPGWWIDREPENAGGAPTENELRQSRWQGVVMIAFGLTGLYAILTWDGTPAEFIGV
jgi:hypothetical protein